MFDIILVCVFETFRNKTVKSFKLEPAHYLSTPGHSWDASLMLI